MNRIDSDIERILITEEEIKRKVKEVGQQIAEDFDGKDPVFVGVLKGCYIFMADLVRDIPVSCSVDFMAVSSYSGTSSTGAVKINKDLNADIQYQRHEAPGKSQKGTDGA